MFEIIGSVLIVLLILPAVCCMIGLLMAISRMILLHRQRRELKRRY